MIELIFQEGDVGVDDFGFVHGPLKPRADRIGFFASGRAWDHHGSPLTDETHVRLVAKWEGVHPPAKDGEILVRMQVETARNAQHEMSDFLCWAAGFNAALHPDECSRSPMGVNAIRTIRHLINRALERIDK